MSPLFNIKSNRIMKVEMIHHYEGSFDQLIKLLLIELEDWPVHRTSYAEWQWSSQDQLEKFITYFILKYPKYAQPSY